MKSTTAFRSVNLLYLIVLCLMVANTLLAWMPQYVRITLNEILFVFLPGYLYLLLIRLLKNRSRLPAQSLAERVRWRWPGWRIAVLALVVGAGLYPLSAASAGILMGVLGYTSFAAPADVIPTTVLMGVLAVLSYAILAPLCEEFLFRGIIQPVYETRGARWSVLFVGFLFVAFHLSLLQGLSIILLALSLGFVNYRTRSLPASMLTHFGANGLAALVITQQVFPTGIQNWITSLPALVVGVLLAGLALFALIRLTSGNQLDSRLVMTGVESEASASQPSIQARRSTSWLASAWPLLAALLIYLPMISVEWVFSRSPEVIAGLQKPLPAVQVGASPWSSPHTWQYEIRNIADAVVGEGKCSLVPNGTEIELTCSSTVQAYEVKQGQSTFTSSGGQRIDTLRFQAAGSKFVSGSSVLDLQGDFHSQVNFGLGDDRIIVRYQEKGQPEKNLDLPFSQTALSSNPTLPLAPEYTWPWQLASLCQRENEAGSATDGNVIHFNAYTWNNTTRTNGPLVEPRLIKVTGQLPAEAGESCLVESGDRETVEYATINSTLTVVKYFNGIETWILKP
jgi:membrane protease YdiL (CAAX protease family)